MYAILDIESTGGKYNEEGITEIAIHRFDGHQVIDQFISLVDPEKAIQPFVVKLTGINNKMLRTAPKFYEVARRILEITEDAVIVAHNAQFDYRILRTEFRRLGYNFERRTLCTVDLSQKLIPEAASHSLGKLVRSLGIAVSDRHRANGDALATLKLFKVLLSKDLNKTIIKSVIRKESQGELSERQLDLVDSVPSETGVYYLHNSVGDIIFLGKSNNMKKRVNSHFTAQNKKGRHLQKATKKVTYEKTGSELIAVLKEYEEIRRNRPKYNANQPKLNFTHGVFTYTDTNGYSALRQEKVMKGVAYLATFNSAIGAENFIRTLTDDYKLCLKINGLSMAKKACSNFNSNQCKGACIKNEQPKDYNLRVENAVQRYTLSNKNIIIVDNGRSMGEHSAVLIQQGEYKGFGFYDLNHQITNIEVLKSILIPMKNSQNTRHLISTYLRKRKVKKILQLN